MIRRSLLRSREKKLKQQMGRVLVALVLAGLAAAVGAQAPTAPADWSGLWVSERRLGPVVDGPVTLQQVGDRWSARLQGETLPVERRPQDDGAVEWSFTFFDLGHFVGRQAGGDGDIVGHWVQAPGMVHYTPYATPVTLTATAGGAFVGQLRTLAQDVSLNIPLEPAAAPGTYRTFLRNPQRNYGRWFPIESATVVGDELRFADRDGEIQAVGRSIVPGERFTLLFPRFGETFDFTRRARHEAPGFYARRLPTVPSVLPAPVAMEDGWPTAAPAATGLDLEPIIDLIEEIAAFEATEFSQPYIHSLLIAHRGKLVVEEYFHGHHRDLPHDSRSAGKSLASALLGIAVHQGLVSSADQPVYAMLGGVDAYANPDPRKARMTVRHLVTMSSGYHCDDGRYDNPGNEDTMYNQETQPDWYRYTLDLPMVREPGAAGVYCTAGIHLIGAVLRQASGRSLLRFFHEEFATPLGIDYYQMNLSPLEVGYMGGGIRLRPRDFLKLGQLYLDGGVWQGQRLLSQEWVEQSAAAHASLNEADDYGFAWWRKAYEVKGQVVDTYYASGNGGQLLFVVPALELVALINAGNYSDGRTRDRFRDRYMREAILPAAVLRAPIGDGG